MDIKLKEPTSQTISIEGFCLDVLRLDLIDPIISGNKWYKLQGYIKYLLNHNLEGIVTFGGAYSNHLHAAAKVTSLLGLKCVGIVRGLDNETNLSSTLQDCVAEGMQLSFLSRTDYKHKCDLEYLSQLQSVYPQYLIIPEGGSGPLGVEGVQLLAPYVKDVYTDVIVSVGSGTTFQGIASIINNHQQLIGFVPMKNGKNILTSLSIHQPNIMMTDDYHFGGFGKYNEELINFMNTFYTHTQIPTDVVYTAKMFYGICDWIKRGKLSSNKRILAIHTGGLQGNVSIQDNINFSIN